MKRSKTMLFLSLLVLLGALTTLTRCGSSGDVGGIAASFNGIKF
jgi:hypothetical protein